MSARYVFVRRQLELRQARGCLEHGEQRVGCTTKKSASDVAVLALD